MAGPAFSLAERNLSPAFGAGPVAAAPPAT